MEKIRRNLNKDISKPLRTLKIKSNSHLSIDEMHNFSDTEFEKISDAHDRIISDLDSDILLLSSRLKKSNKEKLSKNMDENHQARLQEILDINSEILVAKNSQNIAMQELEKDENAKNIVKNVLDDKCSVDYGINVLNNLCLDYTNLCKDLKGKINNLEASKNEILPYIIEAKDLGQIDKAQKLQHLVNKYEREMCSLRKDYNRCFHKRYVYYKLKREISNAYKKN
jgi:hypothetical protein